jgi:hypothetical protein
MIRNEEHPSVVNEELNTSIFPHMYCLKNRRWWDHYIRGTVKPNRIHQLQLPFHRR